MPLDSVVVLTTSAAGATVSVKACVSLTGEAAESRTWAVKLKVPAAVGVPEITPVAAFRVRPAGIEPALMDQLYGVKPPVACKVALYAVPATAFVSVVVVMTRGGGAVATVKLNAAVADAAGEAESATAAVKLNAPEEVGVPEITPVVALSVRPGGNAPAVIDQLYGVTPPVACRVAV